MLLGESGDDPGCDDEDIATRGSGHYDQRAVRTASAVYPVVSFTEKDLARIEAQSGVRVRCAAEATLAANQDRVGGVEASELSPLMPVVAEKDVNYHGGSAEADMEYATGKVARLSRAARFNRWLRKKLGYRISETQVPHRQWRWSRLYTEEPRGIPQTHAPPVWMLPRPPFMVRALLSWGTLSPLGKRLRRTRSRAAALVPAAGGRPQL